MLMPMAGTREPLDKSSAGVRIIHLDFTYSTDGRSKINKTGNHAKRKRLHKPPESLGQHFYKQIQPQVFVTVS